LEASAGVTSLSQLTVTSGILNINNSISVGDLTLVYGRINGTGTVTLTGTGNWTYYGTLGVTSFVVAPIATFNLTGSADHGLAGTALVNHGVVNQVNASLHTYYWDANSTATNAADGVWNAGNDNSDIWIHSEYCCDMAAGHGVLIFD